MARGWRSERRFAHLYSYQVHQIDPLRIASRTYRNRMHTLLFGAHSLFALTTIIIHIHSARTTTSTTTSIWGVFLPPFRWHVNGLCLYVYVNFNARSDECSSNCVWLCLLFLHPLLSSTHIPPIVVAFAQ